MPVTLTVYIQATSIASRLLAKHFLELIKRQAAPSSIAPAISADLPPQDRPSGTSFAFPAGRLSDRIVPANLQWIPPAFPGSGQPLSVRACTSSAQADTIPRTRCGQARSSLQDFVRAFAAERRLSRLRAV